MVKGTEVVEVVKEISKYQAGKPSVEGSFVSGIPYQPLVAVGVGIWLFREARAYCSNFLAPWPSHLVR